ncbi:precorrin-3B C(17)-methyltransferase [Alphaproteobacteria bacterium]|nr:precorrin-3B C(17)-methyltransferase [Alphaproteobacteria bacterium]MBT5799909.1 precorrin-3B C(17)-methyltransferase [Alphaproteobacteria bacterium]MDC0395192.1 precorrin-3B C(17)-methyltransferase [Alphaproteobacteria bacterium]
MKGRVIVAGLGPSDPAHITPLVTQAINMATDVIGYIPYIARIQPRDGMTLHATDNRVEVERAQHALELAYKGRIVLIVSSGDPGVFAMAAALFEVVEKDSLKWQDIEIEILPGITAMLAAAAKAGAPLGHDFCVINLSDNLKPWSIIEKRVQLALAADFAIAFYNPRSKSRPAGFEKTLTILKENCADNRPVIFARNVSCEDESINIVPLLKTTANMADMRTLVIVGSSQSRLVLQHNKKWVYTPRHYPMLP